MPYNIFVEFIEASTFTKYVYSYLTEDEYLGLQGFLLKSPEAGKVVPDPAAWVTSYGHGGFR